MYSNIRGFLNSSKWILVVLLEREPIWGNDCRSKRSKDMDEDPLSYKGWMSVWCLKEDSAPMYAALTHCQSVQQSAVVLEKNRAEGKNKTHPLHLHPSHKAALWPPPLSFQQVSNVDCGEMNKLTCLFWAKGQRQTCQWSQGNWQGTRLHSVHPKPCFPSALRFYEQRSEFLPAGIRVDTNTAISSSCAVYCML